MLRMKSASAAAIAASLIFSASPALAAPICLKSYLIDHTTIGKDATTIDFHMKGGDVWRNTLRHKCQDLKWYGFVYVMRGPDEVCENLQAIRVIHTNQTCLLGPFERVSPTPPNASGKSPTY